MSVSVIRGTNDKPASSQELVKILAGDPALNGQLFVGYPVIATAEGPHSIDALLVSLDKGLVIFDLIEGADPGEYQRRQDDSANKLEARLKTHRELMDRRNLRVIVSAISFGPRLADSTMAFDGAYPLANRQTLLDALARIEWQQHDESVYASALSAVQSISTIRKTRTRRAITRADSRGDKLRKLEDSIATLDDPQNKAVVETVDGVQRIRGLAGSGKTIVLALKAAYLHAQHPHWRIAVTFNTRSLKGQFRRLITNFSLEQARQEPDWNRLRILNAWGAPGGDDRDGIYYEFCRTHGASYFDFQKARAAFGREKEFSGACEAALQQTHEWRPTYDVILVDEAQDFPSSFLRLCYELLDEHKRLVYAYDELQSLSGESLPPPEDTFGTNANGTPKVSFSHADDEGRRHDIFLEKCYRNSRPVLVTAHALGFGVYRKVPPGSSTGLVQMFEHPQLWQEIGYRCKEGKLEAGELVTLYRSENVSPKFLEQHSHVDDLVQFIEFKDDQEQAEWLINAIQKNLAEDDLGHDDIIVINPDPLTTAKKVGGVRRRLLELGINSHIAGVDTNPDVFFQPDVASVTFTGIYRAKGNEAGMVYVINAHDCHSSAWNLASIRNRLFTAITRSKAWVRVLGIGSKMAQLKLEFESLKEKNFELHFTYPTKKQREQLRIIHRDISTEDQARLRSREQSLAELVSDLEAGNVYREDLPEGLLAKLAELLVTKRD